MSDIKTSYYYSISDITNASYVTLVYTDNNITKSNMTLYNISDFKDSMNIYKSDDSKDGDLIFRGDIKDPSVGIKFNYIVFPNPVTGQILAVSLLGCDYIDTSEYLTETITIRFIPEIITNESEMDLGDLTVHIGMDLGTVHRDIDHVRLLTKDTISKLPRNSVFKQSKSDIDDGEFTHYSGNLMKKIKTTLMNVNVVKEFESDILYPDQIMNYDILNIDGSETLICWSGNLIMVNGSIRLTDYKITKVSKDFIIMDNKIISWHEFLNNSRDWKDLKSNYIYNYSDKSIEFYGDEYVSTKLRYRNQLLSDLSGIDIYSNKFYIKDHILYSDLFSEMIELPYDTFLFISDTLFMISINDNYELIELVDGGINRYPIGSSEYLHSIFMVSKNPYTNPRSIGVPIVSNNGVLYYKIIDREDHVKFISI